LSKLYRNSIRGWRRWEVGG